MFKKIVVTLLILCMTVSIMIPASAGADIPAGSVRNGFTLTPSDSDSTGVSPDSKFSLVSQNDITLDELKSALSIDGEPAPNIENVEKNRFDIIPSRQLMENKIYTFRIKLSTETSWSFQTRSSFKILGSLPADESVNVPVNSGIEIEFSHENYEDIDSFFEISPKVEGRFERHKKTAVFVPKKLEEGTIYTVRIKKGLKIKDSVRSIEEDYIFSFETAKDSTENQIEKHKGYIAYSRNIYDFTTGSIPQIPVNIFINTNVYKESTIDVSTKIYAYGDFDSFYNALAKKLQIPYWAQISYDNNLIEVSGLEKVLEFSQKLPVETDNYSNQCTVNIPKTLPPGYYVVDSNWADIHFQTFIQITDTGIYLIKSATKTLVWLNDLSTKLPLEGAAVTYGINGNTILSDPSGIACFNTEATQKGTDYTFRAELLKVTTREGKKSVIDCSYFGRDSENLYWNYIFTDRSMYKPNDTVNLWGFVKNRYTNEEIRNLTIELNKGYYSGTPIIKQSIDVSKGFFNFRLKLPMLEQGGYILQVKSGDTVISSTYISVYSYTKPSYKIEITKDKQAVFPGQEVNFNIKASFFEGTGVSNLKVNYFIQDYYISEKNINSNGITDVKGNYNVKYVPNVAGKKQGEQYARLDVRALLPESGEISESDGVRVFINDINADITGETKDQKGIINAKVNKIVLDRLNNGTAKDSEDYLGDPVGNKKLSGTIYKNTWVQKENGEYYDFINKVTRKRYTYELVKDAVKNFDMTTAADGKASFSFDAPEIKDTYYTASIKCVDNSGRDMEFEVYVGRQYYNPNYDDYDYYDFEGGKESYSLGDTVDLTLKKGKNDITNGSFLFVTLQNGIRKYIVSSKPVFSDKFGDEFVPNADIMAIHFDGNSYYASSTFNALYKIDDKKLVLDAKADKDSYKPGEQATIKISVKDKDGKPVKAFVNTSIVDEAYFKLADQDVNLLEALYNRVGSGIYFQIKSHEFSENNVMLSRGEISKDSASFSMTSTTEKAAPEAAALNSGAGSSTSIREDFRDTAYFESVTTDETGIAELKFKLPDNVTSWRITLGAISEDMHAGSNKVSMNVSLPFFINYSFNTTYLEGDKPVMGVNAYGDNLKEDDLVMFEVSSVQNPALKVSAVGKAFERTNIPLWSLSEGIYDLIIKAYTNSGLSDSVKHTVNVVKSYYQINRANYFDVAPNAVITGGKSGNTTIIFRDKSRGRFLSELISILYSDGNRIDQKLSHKTASELLLKYFSDYRFLPVSESLTLDDFQKENGGLSLLPYTQGNIEISAKLVPLAKDYVDTYRLKNFFYDILDGEDSSGRVLALYGLSALEEPVLLELDKTTAVENLSLKDSIYLALAYCELDETVKAKQVYDSRIFKFVEEYKPFFRVNTGNDKDDILELTSLCAYLASKLGLAEKNGLFEYCSRNSADEVLLSIEKLMFIINEIDSYSDKEAGFTYSYNGDEKTVELGKGGYYSLTIPSSKMSDFKITKVQGDVSAVSIYKENVLDINRLDKDISVVREYFLIDGTPIKSNILKQGDIVKVRITWNIGSKALDGGYEITDYLPSGLKPVENYLGSYYYNRSLEGQKVKFYAYNSSYWKKNNTVFEYFARVVSPGTYTAQGTVIQSSNSKDSINVGRTETIEIDSNGEDISTPIDPNGVKVEINGRPIIFDVQPIIKNGRTLVPLRSIFEVLGADVKWDAKTRTVTAEKEGKKIILTINSNNASVNGTKTVLDVPATIIGNRTFVPTRFISESMGSRVDWNAESKTVQITN
jgi:hypothetical protein